MVNDYISNSSINNLDSILQIYTEKDFYVENNVQVSCGVPQLHHHDCLEIGYCYSGNGIFYTRNDTYPFNAGNITLAYPGEPHDIRNNTSESSWKFIYANVPALFENHPDKERLTALVYGEQYRSHICNSREQHSLVHYVQQMIHIFASSPTTVLYKPYLTALLSCMLYETERLLPLVQFEQSYYNAPIELANQIYPAVEYLHTHFTEQVKIMELNTLCYISNSHLRRGFTTIYGISPSEFLHQLRIKYACSLLSNTKNSILTIAAQCGYTSTSSLNRQFLKFMHMTPLAYRKKHNDWQTSDHHDSAL